MFEDQVSAAEKQKERLNFLASLPLFQQNRRKVTLYAMLITKHSFSFKETVYSQGDPVTGIWIVARGEFKLVKAVARKAKIDEGKPFSALTSE